MPLEVEYRTPGSGPFRSGGEAAAIPGGVESTMTGSLSLARRALLCLAMMLAPGWAMAGTGAVSNLETHTRLDGIELVLNGAGLRNFLFLDVYAVALYLPRRLTDANDVLRHDLPRRVWISFLREVSPERDVEYLLDSLRENNMPEELAPMQDRLEQFMRMIRAAGTLAKGSVVQLDYLPRVGTRVWLNQRHMGTVPGADFNRAVLRIWLGEQPTQESLKRALLGKDRDTI
jgi:hypothetical protein